MFIPHEMLQTLTKRIGLWKIPLKGPLRIWHHGDVLRDFPSFLGLPSSAVLLVTATLKWPCIHESGVASQLSSACLSGGCAEFLRSASQGQAVCHTHRVEHGISGKFGLLHCDWAVTAGMLGYSCLCMYLYTSVTKPCHFWCVVDEWMLMEWMSLCLSPTDQLIWKESESIENSVLSDRPGENTCVPRVLRLAGVCMRLAGSPVATSDDRFSSHAADRAARRLPCTAVVS